MWRRNCGCAIGRFGVPCMPGTRNGRAFVLFILSANITLSGCAEGIFWLLLTSQSFSFLILSDAIKVFSFCVVLFDSFGFFVALFDPSSFFALLLLFYSSRFFASFF